ncbi:MAG: L-glutamate gamma-semialdehyde dehydrogenase [Flavobacteriaceae bacterium]|nr:L-glutamate gamma-semialdehyde dehydrogenase [Flavobacteriaceae bacterium]
MTNAIYKVPTPVNEVVRSYRPNSEEVKKLILTYRKMHTEKVDVPLYIGDKEVKTNNTQTIHPPHQHQHCLGEYHLAGQKEVDLAINSCLAARKKWINFSWQERAAIFLKAAALISGPYREQINAATMLCQSKNVHQAEIDAACETIDFFRYNVYFMSQIYQNQPVSSPNVWNMLEYRPLEGFVYAVTPFNFTAIAANLVAAPVMMGNVVVWKPSDHQIYSAHVLMKVFKEAGVPEGVINLISGDPKMITERVLTHKAFSGLHFTGSTNVFRDLWKSIGQNISHYNNYPRIVGETGGKDFIWAHPSANPKAVTTAIIRGAFEFQGQKCSAASRVYLPTSLWKDIKDQLVEDMSSIKMGSPEDPSNFMNAVIDKKSFKKLSTFLEQARADDVVEFVMGGNYDDAVGYFVEPTVLRTDDPNYVGLREEFFGPIVTVYVYDDEDWEKILSVIDQTGIYALTGAIFSDDRNALKIAAEKLIDAAGNLYINDKPTGAVVGQQPFGGARASGTNDKAGSEWNLLRWVSIRTIKETFVPPENYRYPFLDRD